jgi:spore coat-associated protein N
MGGINMKKRMATALLASTVVFAGLVGAGTYAYFNDVESSTGNTVQAGTLKLSSYRNDMPISGPMFYTNSTDDGVIGTGLWKPGDTHTRGMFIHNDGSLTGKLKKITAAPEAASGSQAYDDAMAFAEQSNVTISVLEPVGGEGTFDSTTYAEMLKFINEWYKNKYDEYWAQEAQDEGNLSQWELLLLNEKVIENIETEMLGKVFTTTLNGKTISGKVADIITNHSLKDLVNNGVDASAEALKLPAGEDMYFAYTVTFLNLDPETNNPLQGKEVKFTFASEYVQE